jgi:hypothetical protein
MKTIGLIPSQQLASLQQDSDGQWLNIPEGQTVVPLVKIDKPATSPGIDFAPQIVWFADRVERQWQQVTVEVPPAPPITVNRRAFRLALVQAGLFTGVVAAINGIEAETDRLSAQVWWEDTLVFHRDHPLIATFATVLNKTTAEVDALFAAAKQLDSP